MIGDVALPRRGRDVRASRTATRFTLVVSDQLPSNRPQKGGAPFVGLLVGIVGVWRMCSSLSGHPRPVVAGSWTSSGTDRWLRPGGRSLTSSSNTRSILIGRATSKITPHAASLAVIQVPDEFVSAIFDRLPAARIPEIKYLSPEYGPGWRGRRLGAATGRQV